MVGSSVLSTVYGYEVSSSNDRLVEVVETAVAGFSQAGTVSSKSLSRYESRLSIHQKLIPRIRLLC
jgi:hypothetical protein